MKNLPEDELFNSLETRLRNYSEEPDDEVWIKIAEEFPSSRRQGLVIWSDRIAVASLFALFFFIFYREGSYQEAFLKSTTSMTKPPVSMPGKLPANTSSATVAELNTGIGDIADSTVLEKATPRKSQTTARFTLSQSPTADHHVGADNSQELSFISPFFPVGDHEVADSSWVTASDSVEFKTKMDKVSVDENPGKELSQKKRKGKSGITLYTVVTPQLSFNHVSPHANDNVIIEELESPPVLSMERLGINMEVGIQGEINRRWQYLAGVSYYHQSHRITYEQQSDGAIITSQADLSYTLIPGTTQNSFSYSMHNIGVQAGILYTLKQRGLSHKAGIVLQYQKGLSHATEDEFYNNAASDYLNYQLLYRVEYRLNSKMNVFIQPGFTHSIISNESLQAPFSLKQSRAGIGIGIVYSF